MSDYPKVDAYLALDFSRNGDAAAALLSDSEIASESSRKEIFLTDVVGSAPASITPHMRNWYAQFVEPYRRPAIDEIDNVLKGLADDTTVGAALVERQADMIEDEKIRGKRAAREQHVEQNAAEFSILEEKRATYSNASRLFERRKMERRRDPKIVPWYYWLIILVVGIAEAFINFETFESLSFTTPFTSLGLTFVVAFLIALSSHLYGKFFSEYQFRFGDQRRPSDVMAAYQIFGFGTLALVIAMGAVWYARSNYLADVILEQSVIGGTPPSWISVVGGSLLGNLGVWAVGTIVSFLFHDNDPEYPALWKSNERHSKAFRKMEADLGDGIERELRRLDAIASDKTMDARQLSESMLHKEAYQAARKAFDRLSAQDTKVLALLQAYQSRFVSASEEGDSRLMIHDAVGENQRREISHADYGAGVIRLKYI